ncbi:MULTISPECIES: thioesterase family protein [Micrococcaceae]|uniref:acyl-CoA thioesterase n=1 Tax=Micrococcaceae TaxID=1268 RepID=UPI001621F035|nr:MULTISPECIES: thioesterase family protein [Micrococcaceae]MBB5747848.1 acyl-CoA thioester hydrolase [Micrococcus sp. TA1]HRO31685.1 thioesterase family protein [Citricoccus sp.]HRO94568.1 thioesterase family protein [Citricoccus sp.]
MPAEPGHGLTGRTEDRPDGGGPAVRVDVPVRWGDMDAYGHVNNVQVAAILEEVRILAFGVPAGTGAPGAGAPVNLLDGMPDSVQVLISEHRIRYRRPLEYRNVPVRAWVWVAAAKGASIEIAYSLRDGVDGTECVTATSTMVFVDSATGRPVRLSEDQKHTLTHLAP